MSNVTKCSTIHHQTMINCNGIQLHFVLNHAFYEATIKFYHQTQKAIVNPYDSYVLLSWVPSTGKKTIDFELSEVHSIKNYPQSVAFFLPGSYNRRK